MYCIIFHTMLYIPVLLLLNKHSFIHHSFIHINGSVAGYSPEKPKWCSIDQPRSVSNPEDWILRYTRTYLYFHRGHFTLLNEGIECTYIKVVGRNCYFSTCRCVVALCLAVADTVLVQSVVLWAPPATIFLFINIFITFYNNFYSLF